jgi:hypothetical protein
MLFETCQGQRSLGVVVVRTWTPIILRSCRVCAVQSGSRIEPLADPVVTSCRSAKASSPISKAYCIPDECHHQSHILCERIRMIPDVRDGFYRYKDHEHYPDIEFYSKATR